MRNLLSLVLLGLFLCITPLSKALNAQWNQFFDPSEFLTFHPERYFYEFSSPHYPELADINPDRIEQIRRFTNTLHNTGIPIGIGTNANNHTSFELYLPLISRPDGLVGPTIGITQESQVGNHYFIDHDTAHHVVGIPGVRLRHLLDPESAEKALVELQLLKEQAATIHSMKDYLKWYWNWRDIQSHGTERPDFVAHNQGMYSLGPLNDQDYVEMIEAFVHGRSWAYGRLLASRFQARFMQSARRAGVPLPGPIFHPYIGIRGESYAYALLVPILEPLVSRYREVGYVGFKTYSQAMAKFMLQPWYVEWSDHFDFGIPIEELTEKTRQIIQDLREGKLIGDEEKKAPQEFYRQFLKHEVALFGRRIAEIRELARRGKLSELYTPALDRRMIDLYNKALDLHERVIEIPDSELSAADVDSLRQELAGLMNAAESLCPVDRVIPLWERLPMINYSRYWRDITALAISRYGHNSGAFTPTEIKNLVRQKELEPHSWWVRKKRNFSRWFHRTAYGKPELEALKQAMAADYQASELDAACALRARDSDCLYVSRMENLRDVIGFQLQQVIIPKLSEVPGIESAARKKLYQALESLLVDIEFAFNTTLESYQRSFVENRSSSSVFSAHEQRLNVYLDRLYSLLFKISLRAEETVVNLDFDDWTQAILGLRQEFRDISSPLRSSTADEIRGIVPRRAYRWQVLSDALAKLSIGRADLMSSVNSFTIGFRFLRGNKQHSARIEGYDPSELQGLQGPIVLALNHEQALLEIHMAYRIFEAAKMDQVFVLTTKKAWSMFPKGRHPYDAIYIEETKPLDELVTRVKNAQAEGKRVGILVCPEGLLPSMYAHMPIAVKPGAFVLARKLAIAMQAQGLPTHLLAGLFNGHEHYTSDDIVDLKLKLFPPTIVPTTPLTGVDSWVAEQRLAFENLLNQTRGTRLVDMIHPRRASGTDLPVTSTPQAYLPFSEWFKGSVFKRCAAGLAASKLQK